MFVVRKILMMLILGLVSPLVCAETFSMPAAGDNMIGRIRVANSMPGDTLFKIGRRHDIGYNEMVQANRGVDPKNPLSRGTRVIVPSRFVLPPGPRKGIVINLAELRLYYYLPGGRKVITEPVGIGREGWETPLGSTRVISKVRNPYWYPTANVRADAKRLGYDLPKVYPPGPDNPLGKHAIRLGWQSYLIHGTNKARGVGERSSAGCIRMFPEDIKKLFSIVTVGTTVRVVDTPFKVGMRSGKIFIEAHKPLQERHRINPNTSSIVNSVYSTLKNRNAYVKWSQAKKAVRSQTGIPTEIGVLVN